MRITGVLERAIERHGTALLIVAALATAPPRASSGCAS
jgi:hypothetical protein